MFHKRELQVPQGNCTTTRFTVWMRVVLFVEEEEEVNWQHQIEETSKSF